MGGSAARISEFFGVRFARGVLVVLRAFPAPPPLRCTSSLRSVRHAVCA